jgi:RNA polymerase sigma factor (TIGR02999 family)
VVPPRGDEPAGPPPGEVTLLLLEWGSGNAAAMERLVPLIYEELRSMAARYLRRENPGHTLQPTALVHEAYLKLVDQKRVHWKNRAHFYGVAAQAMRRILLDHARSRDAAKRGGGRTRVAVSDTPGGAQPREIDLIALDQALNRLSALDGEQARIVELRYFGGLTIDETAEVVGVSTATIERDWRSARAWLHQELQRGAAP